MKKIFVSLLIVILTFAFYFFVQVNTIGITRQDFEFVKFASDNYIILVFIQVVRILVIEYIYLLLLHRTYINLLSFIIISIVNIYFAYTSYIMLDTAVYRLGLTLLPR